MGAIDIFMSDDYFGLGDGLHGWRVVLRGDFPSRERD
jgi:hypothetical protein